MLNENLQIEWTNDNLTGASRRIPQTWSVLVDRHRLEWQVVVVCQIINGDGLRAVAARGRRVHARRWSGDDILELAVLRRLIEPLVYLGGDVKCLVLGQQSIIQEICRRRRGLFVDVHERIDCVGRSHPGFGVIVVGQRGGRFVLVVAIAVLVLLLQRIVTQRLLMKRRHARQFVVGRRRCRKRGLRLDSSGLRTVRITENARRKRKWFFKYQFYRHRRGPAWKPVFRALRANLFILIS